MTAMKMDSDWNRIVIAANTSAMFRTYVSVSSPPPVAFTIWSARPIISVQAMVIRFEGASDLALDRPTCAADHVEGAQQRA